MTTKSKEVPTVTFKADSERAMDLLTLDEWIAVEEGGPKAMKALLSKFMFDPTIGEYLTVESAGVIIGQMTLRQLFTTAEALRKDITEDLVPPPSPGLSETPSPVEQQ